MAAREARLRPCAGNPKPQRPAVMTTHYVRDESGFREARPNDVLERVQALLSQRYRVGSPVLISPALTRAQRSCGQDGRARKGDLKTLTPTSLRPRTLAPRS